MKLLKLQSQIQSDSITKENTKIIEIRKSSSIITHKKRELLELFDILMGIIVSER